MELIIPEIFEQIFQSFRSKQLFDLQLVSKSFLDLVRKCHWVHTLVYLKNDSICSFVLNHFKFRNLLFNSKCNVNSFIGLIKNCHTLDLYWSNITDESVKELKNCHTLNLFGTMITDESAKELKNCHTLFLVMTNITDECVKELRSNGVIVWV